MTPPSWRDAGGLNILFERWPEHPRSMLGSKHERVVVA